MERLIRSQYWTLAWIGAVCLGLMILVLPRLPDQSLTFPLVVIVLGEWIFAFLVSLIIQIKAVRESFSNLRIEPACLSLAIMFFLSAIAIIFSPITQLSTNWAVSMGAGQLIVMTVGIFLLIMTVERIHSHGHEQEVNNALHLQRVTSTRMKRPNVPKTATGNKLGKLWFFSKKSARATESTSTPTSAPKPGEASQTIDQPPIPLVTAAIPEEPILPSQSPSDIVKTAVKKPLEDLPAEIRRLPSVHPNKPTNKVIDPNKPLSSTITKLQALSASGIGSVHHPATPRDSASNIPRSDQVAEEPGLRSMLNRLDAPKQSPAEALPPVATPSENLSVESTSLVSASSLFEQSVDKEMDDIFAKIAPVEAQKEVTHANKNRTIVTPPQTEAPIDQEPTKPSLTESSIASPASTGDPRLFQGKVDDQIEELFSEIVSPQAQREVTDFIANQTKSQSEPASSDIDVSQELKDFGRLSTKGSEGTSPPAPIGTMKTIGKLLIDSQDVDNIIKKAQAGNITVNLPSARVISAVRGEGIQSLLDNIDNYHGVAGSMLVGGDGLVIASTYTAGGDRDSLGVLAHGILGNSNLAMLRLDLGKLDQMIFVSELTENDNNREVTTILTDVEVGALAVFVDSPLVIPLEQLLEQLSTIARG